MIDIDARSTKPIYEQIIQQFKYHVLKGNIRPGDQLPSVRKMALELKVTPGTVAKAYQELERQKIIVTIRGKGAFIADDIVLKEDNEKLEQIKEVIKAQLMELTYMGIDKNEIINMIDELYQSLQ